MFIEFYVLLDDVVHHVRMILRLKGSHSDNHPEQSHSDCPQIDPLVVASTLIDLRGHVEGSANDCQ